MFDPVLVDTVMMRTTAAPAPRPGRTKLITVASAFKMLQAGVVLPVASTYHVPAVLQVHAGPERGKYRVGMSTMGVRMTMSGKARVRVDAEAARQGSLKLQVRRVFASPPRGFV